MIISIAELNNELTNIMLLPVWIKNVFIKFEKNEESLVVYPLYIPQPIIMPHRNKENNKIKLLFSFSVQMVPEIILLLCFEYIINLFIFVLYLPFYFIFEAIIPPDNPPIRLIGIIRKVWNVTFNLLIISNSKINMNDIINPFIKPIKNPFNFVFLAG